MLGGLPGMGMFCSGSSVCREQDCEGLLGCLLCRGLLFGSVNSGLHANSESK